MRYIYCHPLFDERKCAHRFSFGLKSVFKGAGLNLERFDYSGTGEAEGRFSDVCLETLQQDIKREINNSRVSLIGLRFGASLALEFCLKNKQKVRNLILIEPIVDGGKYIEYLYRKQRIKDIMTGNEAESAITERFFNIEGYKTNRRFIEQIKHIQLLKIGGNIQPCTTVYIIQISTSSKVKPEYNLLEKHLCKTGAYVHVEVFNLAVFWERIPISDYSVITEKIVGWC